MYDLFLSFVGTARHFSSADVGGSTGCTQDICSRPMPKIACLSTSLIHTRIARCEVSITTLSSLSPKSTRSGGIGLSREGGIRQVYLLALFHSSWSLRPSEFSNALNCYGALKEFSLAKFYVLDAFPTSKRPWVIRPTWRPLIDGFKVSNDSFCFGCHQRDQIVQSQPFHANRNSDSKEYNAFRFELLRV